MPMPKQESLFARKGEEYGALELRATNNNTNNHETTNSHNNKYDKYDNDKYDNDNNNKNQNSIFPVSPTPRPTATTVTNVEKRNKACSRSFAPPPVYRQYIADRVSGNSYVPLHQRTTPRGKGRPKESSVQQSHSNSKLNRHRNDDDHQKKRAEDDHVAKMFAEADDDNEEEISFGEQEDPLDCQNRPPHFLCFVPPCVRRWPGCMEQNALCECLGRVGCHACFKNHHLARRRIFFIGFVFNFLSLCLTIVACLAFSQNYTLLSHTSFSRGDIVVPEWGNITKATVNIGFRAVAVTDSFNVTGVGDSVLFFEEFCNDENNYGEDSVKGFLSNDFCGECKDSSQQFVLTCVINLIIILRNMFSDITRMYPKYDLNCPNCYGSLMATVSVFLGLWIIVTYQGRCLNNVAQDLRPFYLNNFTNDGSDHGTVADEDLIEVQFLWTSGPGLECLMAATFLRFVDAICNFIVPTPSITRHLEEQQQYETEFAETTMPMDTREEDYEDDDEDEIYLNEGSSDGGMSYGRFLSRQESDAIQEAGMNVCLGDNSTMNGRDAFDEEVDSHEDFQLGRNGVEGEAEGDPKQESSVSSLQQVRPPWDRRWGLPSIREECSQEISVGGDTVGQSPSGSQTIGSV